MKIINKKQQNNSRRPQDWKPGQSGNPKGRPKKGYSITEWFKNMLKSNPTIKDAIGRSIIKKALQGDIAAQRLVWQYMDGMPPQKQVLAGDKDAPLISDEQLTNAVKRVIAKTSKK